jgi:hypothetical protein
MTRTPVKLMRMASTLTQRIGCFRITMESRTIMIGQVQLRGWASWAGSSE